MKRQPFVITTLAAMSLIGCEQGKPTAELAGVTDQNATLIVFDSDDEMIDFVHVAPEDHIERVEFLAPENGDTIAAVAVGPALHADFPDGMVVTSKKAEGFQGKITAQIKDGVVQQLMGNGIGSGSPLTSGHLAEIHAKMKTDDYQHAESTRIITVDPAIRELIVDDEGNRVPPELTADQRDFLNTVVQAVKAKDIETLKPFSHRDPDDRSSYDSTRRYWESILEKDLHHYRFMRFNPDHPNNQNKLELHDGRRIRHSLDPEWILTLYHTPEDAYMVYSSDFLVGNDDGQLKFPATYADPPPNP